ncbi:MAG: AbrB/MazE/SpoVT family DNA-binding domain-containing protein [Planctomycetes bacterium]|nr:AbrB/MazE/SpoVT family DNA-binding domain-containing protein [Planctomycetota bacterium]
MTLAEIIRHDGLQSVKLPAGFQFDTDTVSIRREGDAVVLEPVKSTTWPPGFFASIRIDDPQFERPDQGQVPTAPVLD